MRWMLRDVGSERTFRLFAIVLFALLAGLNYFPALIGKIPFPRDLVLQFPAWREVARSEPLQRYADIGDLAAIGWLRRSSASPRSDELLCRSRRYRFRHACAGRSSGNRVARHPGGTVDGRFLVGCFNTAPRSLFQCGISPELRAGRTSRA